MTLLHWSVLVLGGIAGLAAIVAMAQYDLRKHYEQLWRVERKMREESDQSLEKVFSRSVRLQLEAEGRQQRLVRKNDALRRKMLRQRWYIGKLEKRA